MFIGIQVEPNPLLAKLQQDFIIGFWHSKAKELGEMEASFVRYRTMTRAYDTGSLARSITHKDYPKSTGPLITKIYADDREQIDEWGRVYAPYQEGPPMGLSTYTNGPRHVFYDAIPDDLEAIREEVHALTEEALAMMGVA